MFIINSFWITFYRGNSLLGLSHLNKFFAKLVRVYDRSRTYEDMIFFIWLFHLNIPRQWDENTPEEEITRFLLEVRDSQSPGVRYLQDRIRTPHSNRPTIFWDLDATHIGSQNSADPFLQMGRWSGPRGKGHCVLVLVATSPDGSILYVSPGKVIFK